MDARAPRDEVERLTDLIGAIYDCVLDPDRWDPTLDDLRDLLDCANVVFYVANPATGEQRFQRLVGINRYWAARLPRHESDLADLHATVPDFYTRALDEPFVCHQDVAAETWLANRFHREWAAPQDIVDVIDTILIRRPDRTASCALCRHETAGPIGAREIRLARLLAPHLRRAVTVSDLIDMKSLRSEALACTLDAMSVGVVLVAEDGAVVHANLAATCMFEADGPLRSIGGRLHAGDSETTARLGQVIARAIAHEPGIGAAGIGMALPAVNGGGIATAHVLPLASGALRTRLLPRAAAAVFVSFDTPSASGALDAVAEAFGLTRSEARLLERLVRGEGTAEAAASLNIAMTTAKTHISRLLAKTGSRRQTDLIALVNRLTPAVQAPTRTTRDVVPRQPSFHP